MMKKNNQYLNKKAVFIVTVLLIIAAATTITGILVYRHKLYYHFDVVDPGKLYRSGTLSLNGLKAVYNLIHFKTIVVLRSKNEIKENEEGWYSREADFCKRHGLHLIAIPMYHSTPPTPLQIKQFIDIVTNPKMQPVIVHCHQGVIRTSMMVAAYRIAIMHEHNQYVFNNMNWFGHDLVKENETAVEPFILNFNYKKTITDAN